VDVARVMHYLKTVLLSCGLDVLSAPLTDWANWWACE